MSALLELAERCEAATGPDVELDLDISEATGGWKALATWKGVSYTASVDAALTLVPEPKGYRLFRYRIGRDGDGKPYAHWVWGNDETKHIIDAMGIAATEALAICAAALRARGMEQAK